MSYVEPRNTTLFVDFYAPAEQADEITGELDLKRIPFLTRADGDGYRVVVLLNAAHADSEEFDLAVNLARNVSQNHFSLDDER